MESWAARGWETNKSTVVSNNKKFRPGFQPDSSIIKLQMKFRASTERRHDTKIIAEFQFIIKWRCYESL